MPAEHCDVTEHVLWHATAPVPSPMQVWLELQHALPHTLAVGQAFWQAPPLHVCPV